MAIKFEIHYDENPFRVYYTGQIVKGRAVIHLDEPIPIKGVRIRVRGYARVRWDESTSTTNSDGTTSSTSDTHSDEEKYFEAYTECIDNRGSEKILEVGTHTFSFECLLPIQCPSSFEGTYGRIRYDTKVTIVRPILFNKSHSAGFNVFTVFDLNRFPHLMIPTSMEVFKDFCCQSKGLILTGCIQQTGFVPGEYMNINVKLNNRSSTFVEQIRVALNLIAFYSVRRRVSTKTEKIAVAKKKFGVNNQELMEINDKIQVPPTPPTLEEICKIIKITYELEIIAKVQGPHRNPVLSIPITIGNIPFVAKSAFNSGSNAHTSESSTNLDSEAPPPSYEEAVYVHPLQSTMQRDEKDCEKFVPRYPFYNVLAPIPSAPKSDNLHTYIFKDSDIKVISDSRESNVQSQLVLKRPASKEDFIIRVMAITFEIHYDGNPLRVYYTGQVVKGRAVIHVDEPISVKGVRIRVRGIARVRWSESNNSRKHGSRTDVHSDQETYFEAFTECIDTKGSEQILEVGTHTYNFECLLPIQCPSSFEGTYGRIRYDTKIIIVRPILFNKSHSAGFNVLTVFDLNRFPHLVIPTTMEVQKNFCCGCCRSRPLILSGCMQQTAFVPGEFMNINVKLNNQSSVFVEQIRIALNLIAFYSVRTRVRTKTEKIAVAKEKFVVSDQSFLEINAKIQVPATPPNLEQCCQIIRITYELEVTPKVKGAHINPVLSIPITIGNIPFAARSGFVSGSKEQVPGCSTNLDGEAPPPSYEEAVYVHPLQSTILKNETDCEKFVPRYPFYNTLAST